MSYAPYVPLSTSKPFGEGLWIVDGPAIGYRLGGVSIPCPTRMTIARLGDGLWVHSPVELNDEVRAAVATLGPVHHLVVPNGLHTSHARAWAGAFPEATVHAPASISRGKLPPHTALGEHPPAEWHDAFDVEIVRGDGFVEAVFHHRPSRTLIVTDLMQTFEAKRVDGTLARTLLRLGGATGPVGKPSVEVRIMLARHRRAFRRSVERMKGWRFERIVLAHGPCFERNGIEELERAFG